MSQFTVINNDSYTAKAQLSYDFAISDQIIGYCEAFGIEDEVQFNYTKFTTYIHNAIVATLSNAGMGATDISIEDSYNLQLSVLLDSESVDDGAIEVLNSIDELELVNEATMAAVSS